MPTSLVADANGDLIGATFFGGAYGDGTIFEIPKTATGYGGLTTLVSFNGADGQNIAGSLILDANGDILGKTKYGGAYGDGTVFEVAKTAIGYASTPTTLASFNGTNGYWVIGGLLAGSNGALFGTSLEGGAPGAGTIFEVVNDPGPTAGNAAVTEGHAKTVNLTALINGLITPGLPGDTETLIAVSAANGSAVLGAGNVVTYASPATGPDTVSYTVQDEYGDTATGQVAVTVDPGPTAGNMNLTLPPSQTIDLTGLVLSVVDRPGLPGDTLTLTGISASSTLGTVTLQNGDLVYTAPAGGGTDAFTYTVADQYQDTATGSISVAVNASLLGKSANIPLTGSGNVVDAGAGNVTISGGTGGNAILAGNGNNTVTLPGGFNDVALGDGNNHVAVSGNSNTVTLGNGSNTLSMTGAFNGAAVGNGSNNVSVSGNNSSVAAGKGNNTLSMTGASSGAELGNGNNNVSASGNNSTVTAGNGNNTLSMTGASSGAELGNGNNNVSASGSNSTVTAGNGSNAVRMSGPMGSATLGNGNNNVSVSGSGGTVTAGNGSNAVRMSGPMGSATLGNGNNNVSVSGTGGIVALGNGNNALSMGGPRGSATLGTGTNLISVGGIHNIISVGRPGHVGTPAAAIAGSDPTSANNGYDIIVSGANSGSDTFILNDTTTALVLQGSNNLVFINGGTDAIMDTEGGTDNLLLQIGLSGGSVTIGDFSVARGVMDLVTPLASALDWTTTAQIAAAVTSDHHGGSALSLGSFGSIDFLGVASGTLHATNFQIG